MSEFPEPKRSSSIFFIEIDRVKPNPFQPRTEFDESRLSELAESIRQYGVLQPLVVVRQEKTTATGTVTEYELIAGERRLRASRLAGLREVPVIIRQEPADKVKLELALVENVQREDLNPVDRAQAFHRLAQEFSLTHQEIGRRIGKSREYVANSVRILGLPSDIQSSLKEGRITESHARYLLALQGKPQEQKILFDDIIFKNLTVRDTARLTKEFLGSRENEIRQSPDPDTKNIEEELTEALGARVYVSKNEKGGRVSIEFFSQEELEAFIQRFKGQKKSDAALTSTSLPKEDLEEFTI